METQNASPRANLAQTFHLFCLPLAILVYATGFLFDDLVVMYIGVMSVFIANLVYAFEQLHRRFVFLFFHGGLFLFLLSRPTVTFFRGMDIQAMSSSFDTARFILILLFITLLCLRIGSALAENLQRTREAKRTNSDRAAIQLKNVRDNPKLQSLRIAAGLLFLISWVSLLWYSFLKLQAMAGLDYVQYYLMDFSQTGSLVERTLATFEPIALCAFLAALPSKRLSLLTLLMHLLTTIPNLMIGGRADFVLGALFIVIYYGFRDMTDGKGSWIGHFEKLALLICIPVGLIAMGMLNYVRSHYQSTATSVFDVLVDSVYKQGASYYILGMAYDVQGQIAHMGFKGYSFGGLTDYLLHGPLGSYVFDVPGLPSYNSIPLAVEGTSFAHTMSYFAHWGYLDGHGYGSSYLSELNQDFGLWGVAFFSIFLGFVFSYLPRLFRRNWLWGTIVLMMSMVLFHVPRGATLEWIAYLWTPQFWLAIGLIVAGAALLRSKRFQGFYVRARNVPSIFAPREKTGELDEHSDLRRPLRYRQAENPADSHHYRDLRWLGARPGAAQ